MFPPAGECVTVYLNILSPVGHVGFFPFFFFCWFPFFFFLTINKTVFVFLFLSGDSINIYKSSPVEGLVCNSGVVKTVLEAVLIQAGGPGPLSHCPKEMPKDAKTAGVQRGHSTCPSPLVECLVRRDGK